MQEAIEHLLYKAKRKALNSNVFEIGKSYNDQKLLNSFELLIKCADLYREYNDEKMTDIYDYKDDSADNVGL